MSPGVGAGIAASISSTRGIIPRPAACHSLVMWAPRSTSRYATRQHPYPTALSSAVPSAMEAPATSVRAPPSSSALATSTSSLLAAHCSGVSGHRPPSSAGSGSAPASISMATTAGPPGKKPGQSAAMWSGVPEPPFSFTSLASARPGFSLSSRRSDSRSPVWIASLSATATGWSSGSRSLAPVPSGAADSPAMLHAPRLSTPSASGSEPLQPTVNVYYASALTPPTACIATGTASVVATIRGMWPADSAGICTSARGRPLTSPRRRLAQEHNEDVQQQERHSVEEQARDDVRDRRAVAADEIPPGAPGPQRVADTEGPVEWHAAGPRHVPAAARKIALGHGDAIAFRQPAGARGAVPAVRHRVEDVLVFRADHIRPRVHLGGQVKRGDTRHRDEHEDAGYPAGRVTRRPAMRVGVQRVMQNAALRAHPDCRVGAVQAGCVDYDDNEPGQNESEQHEERDNAESCRRPAEAREPMYVDRRVHREADHAARRRPGPPAPPVMQPHEPGDIRGPTRIPPCWRLRHGL